MRQTGTTLTIEAKCCKIFLICFTLFSEIQKVLTKLNRQRGCEIIGKKGWGSETGKVSGILSPCNKQTL